MIYINKENIMKFDVDNLLVIADFNKTITKGNSKTTWSIFFRFIR